MSPDAQLADESMLDSLNGTPVSGSLGEIFAKAAGNMLEDFLDCQGHSELKNLLHRVDRMSQMRGNVSPNGSEEKKRLFFQSCKVSELLSSLANVENEQQKHQLFLKGTRVSLFHTLRSVIKSNNWKTAVYNKQSMLPPEPTTLLHNWSEDDVAKKDADSRRTTLRSQNSCVSMHVKCLSKSKTTNSAVEENKNTDCDGPLPAHMLPYVLLIKNCLPLSISSIYSKCCKAEILCRILYFTQRLWKKKTPKPSPQDPPSSEFQTAEETQYVNFLNLKDLQWKFYKGIVKRKQKVRVLWREANYRPFKPFQEKIRNEEYMLPLIPKNWIIHDSLK